ncbi:MAG: hypothetical protein RLZZ319_387 [Actinomycetota bacterium]|jgi:cyclic-di-GMP-binding biofilm dispersal mediator protein
MTDNTALVVGASGALGSLIATELHAHGINVIGTASSRESAESLTEACSRRIVLDLADPRSVDGVVELLHTESVALRSVIIAAGVVAFGPLAETPRDVVDRLMAVNATGPLRLITGLLPLLTAPDATIVTLSGKIAEVPTAGLSAYSASKAALHAASIAAGREVKRSGVRWIDARPGHTETGLSTRALAGDSPNFGTGLDPAAVANRIVTAILGDDKDLPSTAFEG